MPTLGLAALVRVRVEEIEVAADLPVEHFPLVEALDHAPVDFLPLFVRNRASNNTGGGELRTDEQSCRLNHEHIQCSNANRI